MLPKSTLFCVLLLVFLPSASARAMKVITIPLDNYVRYSYIDKNWTGVMWDMAYPMFETMGITVQGVINMTNYHHAVDRLQAGDADMLVAGVFATYERAQQADWSAYQYFDAYWLSFEPDTDLPLWKVLTFPVYPFHWVTWLLIISGICSAAVAFWLYGFTWRDGTLARKTNWRDAVWLAWFLPFGDAGTRRDGKWITIYYKAAFTVVVALYTAQLSAQLTAGLLLPTPAVEDFFDRRVVVAAGTLAPADAREAGFTNVVEARDELEAFKMLKARQADAVFAVRGITELTGKQKQYCHFKNLRVDGITHTVAIALNKKHHDLLPAMNMEIYRSHASGLAKVAWDTWFTNWPNTCEEVPVGESAREPGTVAGLLAGFPIIMFVVMARIGIRRHLHFRKLASNPEEDETTPVEDAKLVPCSEM